MRGRFLYRFIKLIATPFIYILYRPKIVNKHLIPKDGCIVMSGNHVQALDPILLVMSTKRGIRFLAKKELHRGPLKYILDGVGAIPVDRQKGDSKAREHAVEILKDNQALAVFPEGTRNRTKEKLLPFKFGAVSFAKKTNALIVPFAIVGRFKLIGGKLKIVYGEPFSIEDMELEDANKLLYQKISDLMDANAIICKEEKKEM
jgi:1-acyl-sn-glycerol-3-phosphate acyltransferase